MIVEGVRVEGAPSEAPRVRGIVATSSNAAVAVPVGPWANLGVSAASVEEQHEEALLPPSAARSEAQHAQDSAEERKIKFLATLSRTQRFTIWLKKTWIYKCAHAGQMRTRPASCAHPWISCERLAGHTC